MDALHLALSLLEHLQEEPVVNTVPGLFVNGELQNLLHILTVHLDGVLLEQVH